MKSACASALTPTVHPAPLLMPERPTRGTNYLFVILNAVKNLVPQHPNSPFLLSTNGLLEGKGNTR